MADVKQIRLKARGHDVRLKADWDKVFKPIESSLLMAENMEIDKGDIVCEIGTGCGLNSIIASRLGAKLVCAGDVSNGAVEWARYNISINTTPNVCVKSSDLFSSFGAARFNAVLSNLPFGPLPPESVLRNIQLSRELVVSTCAGKTGNEEVVRMLNESVERLYPKGKVFYTLGDITLKGVDDPNFKITKMASATTSLIINDPEYIKFLIDSGAKLDVSEEKTRFQIHFFKAELIQH